MLTEKGFQTTLYEKNPQAGGLVRCTREAKDILFHRVGGHVFNSKNKQVLNWFWKYFDKSNEFLEAKRNASIYLNGEFLGYPIENNVHLFSKDEVQDIISELLNINSSKSNEMVMPNQEYSSFKDFLQCTFGPTLCKKYFFPYNEKIWNKDLSKIPLAWLEGKLPMPDLKSIIVSNICKNEDMSMVHSTFYYPIEGGSQFIVDRLIDGLDVIYDCLISRISKFKDQICVDNVLYDRVIFTGDVRNLGRIIDWESFGLNESLICGLNALSSNPTSNALCECDMNPYSWVYFPDKNVRCHRAIMTGNFAESNNGLLNKNSKISCTVEFSKNLSPEEMKVDISKLPFSMKAVAFNLEQSSYIIHDHSTIETIKSFRKEAETMGIYLCGRFAEWQYYNMDAAIDSAMKLVNTYF